jgi:hypothetical protein
MNSAKFFLMTARMPFTFHEMSFIKDGVGGLTWRPIKFAPSKNVEMKMRDFFSAIFAVVDDCSEA